MIDPYNITNFNQTDEQLEESLMFWILAAGKTAKVAAASLERFLNKLEEYGDTPFARVKRAHTLDSLGLAEPIAETLRKVGVGCFNQKAETIMFAAFSGFNLRNCTTDELELIKGIGPKTSRCFILHSRKDARVAGLDTHILKFLKSKGHDVPDSTPSSKKKYAELEELFLKYADEAGKPAAEFDLEIWKSYARP